MNVSVPLPGFSGLRLRSPLTTKVGQVSVPLPGFSGLRQHPHPRLNQNYRVSVPLPGFSGLRRRPKERPTKTHRRFSPVAGIQWVETSEDMTREESVSKVSSFSPVAGIQWVETLRSPVRWGKPSNVSVPLPGFSGLRHLTIQDLITRMGVFQSRCRDSVG